MLTKATAKFIKSLQLKKYRIQESLFVVEGTKSVLEVLNSSFSVKMLVATDAFISNHKVSKADEIHLVNAKQLQALGSFKSNDGALAVVQQQDNIPIKVENEWALMLDDINDPGNFGAILRIADWYGINKVIASNETVDLYNSKVITASKGSFTRVKVFYTDLVNYLSEYNSVPTYGAFLDGGNVHNTKVGKQGIIVLGNEANGISPAVESLITHRITIPKFGEAESLNVAMATAIICDNFSRSF